MKPEERQELYAQGLEIHRRHPVIDTHSHFLLMAHHLGKDFSKRHGHAWFWNPFRNVLDLPRLQEGAVACSTFTIYVPPPPLRMSAWKACGRYLDGLDRLVEASAGRVRKVDSAEGIRQAFAAGVLAGLPAVEGGHVIGRKLERLEALRSRGVRILTLTHFIANRICDASIKPEVHGGLSGFGRGVLEECERLGLVVELSNA